MATGPPSSRTPPADAMATGARVIFKPCTMSAPRVVGGINLFPGRSGCRGRSAPTHRVCRTAGAACAHRRKRPCRSEGRPTHRSRLRASGRGATCSCRLFPHHPPLQDQIAQAHEGGPQQTFPDPGIEGTRPIDQFMRHTGQSRFQDWRFHCKPEPGRTAEKVDSGVSWVISVPLSELFVQFARGPPPARRSE